MDVQVSLSSTRTPTVLLHLHWLLTHHILVNIRGYNGSLYSRGSTGTTNFDKVSEPIHLTSLDHNQHISLLPHSFLSHIKCVVCMSYLYLQIKTGDIIRCELDMDEGTLTYLVNGIFKGVAFRDLKTELGTIYPAVCFYGNIDCI